VTVVFGQNIHYYEAGQGPVVILLHGLGSVKEIWMANFGGLCREVSRLHHRSDWLWPFRQAAPGVQDRNLRGLPAGIYAGAKHRQSDAGGKLAGRLDRAGLYHPTSAMVEKLVLVDSAGLASMRPPTVDLNASSLAGMRAILESVFYNKQMVTDQSVLQVFTDHVRNNDAYTIQRMMAGLVTPQFEDAKLATIHAPTLGGVGTAGRVDPVVGGEKLRDGIAGAKLVVFDQCGHVPQLEKAAEFNQALLEFLGK